MHVISPVTLETADKLGQGNNGRVVIKAKPFNGIQSVDGVGEGDELDTNQSVVSTAVVNIPLSFQAATDEGREQRTGTKLDDVSIVEEQKENVIFCSHPEMKSNELFELKKGKCDDDTSEITCW